MGEATGATKGHRAPLAQRLLAVLLELIATPGGGLLAMGRGRAAAMHFGAAMVALFVVSLGALSDTPELVWGGFAFFVLRVFVSAAQCVRTTSPSLGWGKMLAVSAASLALASVVPRVVRAEVVEAFRIPSGSMIPALLPGDHIFVDKSATPKVGDVVVFRGENDGTDYVKRIVAMGPATVRIEGRLVFIDGEPLAHQLSNDACPLAEPCSVEDEVGGGRIYPVVFRDSFAHSKEQFEVKLREGEIYLLGDNRDSSFDSRRFGPVPLGNVKGVLSMVWLRGR